MKKYLLFAFVFTLITMAFSSQAHATDKPMYKAHFLAYTKTYANWVMNKFNYTQKEAESFILKRALPGEARLKKAIMDTDSNFKAQWMFFGPNFLDYDEGDNTIADIYGAFTTSSEPLYQAVENLKSQYNISNINPYIIAQLSDFAKRGENIMIRNASTGYEFNQFLAMVSPEGDNHMLRPFFALFPVKHPDSKKGWAYGTLGEYSVQKQFPVFAHLDSTLVYFENEQGEQDSVYFPLGDAEHNVLDPQKGWKLGNVFDTSGTDLGFHTTPDTLTIQTGLSRQIELYPGWNDQNTGKILYVGGSNFYDGRLVFENEYHCRYYQSRFDTRLTALGAYAVDIPHMEDAFAMGYILVQFVKDITYPSIDQSRLPTDLKSGDEFTIYLKGDYDLMTSWIPEFQVSGIEYEILSQTNHSVTVKALSGGTATITLHHNALLVLDDESVSVTVTGTTDIGEYSTDNITISPNPAGDYIDISGDISGEVKIYDVPGVIHLRQSATATSDGQVRLDVSGLAAGVYFVRIGGQVLKFVKM